MHDPLCTVDRTGGTRVPKGWAEPGTREQNLTPAASRRQTRDATLTRPVAP